MKSVVIIGQMLNTNTSDRIRGGIQIVERMHADVMLHLGYKVYFVASSDTEVINNHPNWHLKALSIPSEEELEKTEVLDRTRRGSINRQKTAEINDILAEIKPDLIINHSYSSSHVRLLAEHAKHTPGLMFIHQTPVVASDISLISKLQQYLELTKRGGHLVCVSRYQRDLWREAIKKRIASGSEHFQFITSEEVDQVYNKVASSAVVQPVQLQSSKGHLIVISRPSREKNVAHFVESCIGIKNLPPIKIFLAHPGGLHLAEYYVKKIAPAVEKLVLAGNDVKVFPNAPRADVLDALATAAGIVLPWPYESAPVALLEGCTYGALPIVFAQRRANNVLDHSAFDMIGGENVIMIDAFNKSVDVSSQLESAITRALSATQADRVALQATTRKLHSFEQRVNEIQVLINDLESTYKERVQAPSLLSFE